MNEQIKTNCKNLLINYPEMREVKNMRKAIWMYWQIYNGITTFINYNKWISSDLPQAESIARAIRLVKHDNPDLRGSEESQKMSKELELKERDDLGYSIKTPQNHADQAELKLGIRRNFAH